MEQYPMISLVIPVYNVENYFDKCMESVLAQTYENYEVILVDDGSTDNSGKMCDEYAEKDGRVTVYHKANGGLSDARNYGVERCKADLVSFIDSDDFVSNDYLEYLYGLKSRYNADIAVTHFLIVHDTEKEPAQLQETEETEERCFLTKEAMKDVCFGRISLAATAKLFPKDVLKKYPFPVGVFYEDAATVYKLIGDKETVAWGSKHIYYYLLRAGSITHRPFEEKHLFNLKAMDEMCAYMEEHFPEAIGHAHMRSVMAGLDLLNTTDVLKWGTHKKDPFLLIRSHILRYYTDVVGSGEVGIKTKVYCMAVRMGYFPSKVILSFKKLLDKLMLLIE